MNFAPALILVLTLSLATGLGLARTPKLLLLRTLRSDRRTR